MARNQRVALLVVTVVVVVVAIVVIGGGSSSSDKTVSGPQTVTVVGAKARDGIKTLTYSKGDRVDLTIDSDTADEIHIHGYDLHKEVPKGGNVHFSFPATIEGRFVVELENHKQQIASLQVQP